MHESCFDRWERIGVTYNILRGQEDGFWVNTNKKGNMSWARAFFVANPVTKLVECKLCHKRSTPKKVSFRSDVVNWNNRHLKDWFLHESKDVLCVGCWNKVRALEKRDAEAAELRLLVNKLHREIKKCQK